MFINNSKIGIIYNYYSIKISLYNITNKNSTINKSSEYIRSNSKVVLLNQSVSDILTNLKKDGWVLNDNNANIGILITDISNNKLIYNILSTNSTNKDNLFIQNKSKFGIEYYFLNSNQNIPDIPGIQNTQTNVIFDPFDNNINIPNNNIQNNIQNEKKFYLNAGDSIVLSTKNLFFLFNNKNLEQVLDTTPGIFIMNINNSEKIIDYKVLGVF
jgi:hypothetical protein